MDLNSIASELIECRTSQHAESLLRELVTNHGGTFRPLGDMAGNHGAVEVGGDSDSALTERITNAIDATLDLEAERNPSLKTCRSPRDLVKKCYGVPQGELAMEGSQTMLEKLADEIGIVVGFAPCDKDQAMTVEVRDHGTGIASKQMPQTILSLHGTNKIEKWYLVGQFGQGGAVTLRFSDYSVIISRQQASELEGDDNIGFTILRYVEPKENERFGSYSYIVGPDRLPFSTPASKLDFTPGTLARHINFEVSFPRQMVPASAYAVLNAKLFDPLVPVWMEFQASEKAGDTSRVERRRIYGNRRRLMRSGYVEVSDERMTDLDGYSRFGKIKVRYWVLKSEVDRKTKANFCDPTNPIHVTHFGQSHSVLARGILKDDCKLPFSYDHVIVQVDCDGLSLEGRRKLFTANREAMTTTGKNMVKEAIRKCLLEDPTLRELEEERRDKQFKEGLQQTSEELRKRLAEMLDRIKPGRYAVKAPAKGKNIGKSYKNKNLGHHRGSGHDLQADYPSYLEINSHGDPLKFYLGSARTILLKTDAPDRFLSDHAESKLFLSEESKMHVQLLSTDVDFFKGWLRITVEPNSKSKEGTEFEFKVSLAFPKDGTTAVLSASRGGIVAIDNGSNAKVEQKVDAPLIVTVSEGSKDWKELGWNYKNVAEVKGNGGASIIYVSLENEWLTGTLNRTRLSKIRVNYIKTRYILQVAFHAFLLHEGILPKDAESTEVYSKIIDDESLQEKLANAELTRAVRSILTSLTTKGVLDDVEIEAAELEA